MDNERPIVKRSNVKLSEPQEELKTYTNPEVDQGPSEHSLSRPKGKQPEQEQTGLHRK